MLMSQSHSGKHWSHTTTSKTHRSKPNSPRTSLLHKDRQQRQDEQPVKCLLLNRYYSKWRAKGVNGLLQARHLRLSNGILLRVSTRQDSPTPTTIVEQFKNTFARRTVRTNEFGNVSEALCLQRYEPVQRDELNAIK